MKTQDDFDATYDRWIDDRPYETYTSDIAYWDSYNRFHRSINALDVAEVLCDDVLADKIKSGSAQDIGLYVKYLIDMWCTRLATAEIYETSKDGVK